MKKHKKIKYGRISLELDPETEKIIKIILHKDVKKITEQSPENLASALASLNGGFVGKPVGISFNRLDMAQLKPFQRKILLCLHENVPAGKVITYGDLAAFAGHPGASRAVGTAMSANPFPMVLPCHRVVLSNREIGRFGPGSKIKRKLLQAEGITFDGKGRINRIHFVRQTKN